MVDDESGIRSGITRILRNFTVSYPFMENDINYSITEAATGEVALEIIKKDAPDIVLLDNKLPGIQGVDVLEFINKNNVNSLVIMITSFASLELAVKATHIGAYDFVPKPFSPQELKTSMENATKHLFLRHMTKKLHKEGKQVRFQFLTLLSHELKSPLNVIEGYLRIMQEKQAGNSLKSYEKMIDQSLARVKTMRTLIMDLLDLTHIEAGRKKRTITQINLKQIAKNAMEAMMPMAIQRDITIKCHEFETIEYLADPEEMEIIFNNLLSNAIKYNKTGGEVVCSAKLEQSKIVISINDTGIGIAQESFDKLFKEFSRIKTTENKNISGSGLGLSIVKKLVNLYNGSVEVESTEGVGTKFKIFLPLENSQKE